MKSEDTIISLVEEFNQNGRNKTFAEFIATLFKDQLIEIYLGDSYEEISTEQISSSYPAVFCGKVVAAYRECLVISAAFIGKDNVPKLGNLMFINERSIRALNQIDGNGIMDDMFMRSQESLLIKGIFKDSQRK